MSPPPVSGGLLPMPGSPSFSWAIYRARIAATVKSPEFAVLVAFWLFGLLNNVLYVIILTAAQDLVGSDVPKGVVLIADVLPGFLTKLVAPYFMHKIPYAVRLFVFVAASSMGMLMVALTPAEDSIGVKLLGVMLASFASGGGESTFLGITHYYGYIGLAAWGSGTGAAGLVGAGLYVVLTDWIGFSVKNSLLAAAFLPLFLLVSFFMILPRGPLHRAAKMRAQKSMTDHASEPEETDDNRTDATTGLLEPTNRVESAAFSKLHDGASIDLQAKLRRMKALFWPYMVPLLLVYVSEYTSNQGVAPTLIFPLESSPFVEYRDFYPFYGFLYQLGVFVSRTSVAFLRVRQIYVPSLLQVANLCLLLLHALFNFLPNVYVVFLVIFWEGLLGGAVYVNAFADILENVPASDREFSLAATGVSDSAGICLAGFLGMAMEGWLCNWQVRHGRDWCKRIEPE